MPADSLDHFVEGVQEVRLLLRSATQGLKTPATHSRYSEEQVFVRAAVVLLTSHLEGFFRRLPEEFADLMSVSWEKLLPGAKRYLLLTAWRRLVDEVTPVVDDDFKNPNSLSQARRSLVHVSRWLTNPSHLSKSNYRSHLTGFYRLRGAKSIDRLTRDFSPDSSSVFDTIEKNGLDRGAVWTVLEGLVNARNQIAHGQDVSLTAKDLRKYLATCIVLARQSSRHLTTR